MALDDDPDASRIAALCHKLGRLSTEKEIAELRVEPTPGAVEECKLLLIGKVPSNPSFNFPAFQSVLKRAWRLDHAEIIQKEAGLYLAKFKSQAEKQRILDTGPWQFSGHLINFKPWIANTPLHSYDFSTCAFWVQIIGLPLECSTAEMIRTAVSTVGPVLQVKSEFASGSALKACRARVELDLSTPLKVGRLIKLNNQTLWLDFRYERLPHYCYSCGRLGHYTDSCPFIPFKENMITEADKTPYGPWLKAEVQKCSPYWQCYYGSSCMEEENEEFIPETPPTAVHTLPLLLPPVPVITSSPQESTPLDPQPRNYSSNMPPPEKHTVTTALIPATEKLKGVQWPPSTHQATKGKSIRPISKISPAKKPRRYSPYTLPEEPTGLYDDSSLLDTPIMEASEELLRATVAGPKQSPNQR